MEIKEENEIVMAVEDTASEQNPMEIEWCVIPERLRQRAATDYVQTRYAIEMPRRRTLTDTDLQSKARRWPDGLLEELSERWQRVHSSADI